MGTSWSNMDPQLRPGFDALSSAVSQSGGILTLTSTLRTFREQTFLYDRYKQGLSTLPANPPGHSAHEYGWAFDAVSSGVSIYDVGALWKSWGGSYGGQRDPVHFELRGAGKLAWQLGEQGYTGLTLAQGAGGSWDSNTAGAEDYRKKGIAAEIAKLPRRWQKYMYSIPDFGIGMLPYADAVTLTATLLKIGYPDSLILQFLSEPIETLHAQFPEYI